MGADNPQERLDKKWIVGFVDGEGCFHVAINQQHKMTIGWQVLPELRVVQHKRDRQVLERMRKTLNVGVVRVNNKDRLELRVRKLSELNYIVTFFEKHPLMTTKHQNFILFKKIILAMNEKKHLTRDGLTEIAKIAAKMNRKVRSRYLESSETIRQTRST
tara:strand:+ start:553 stop:1032 length:480 start_codon:yes stop_codon:yes gene_type:complete